MAQRREVVHIEHQTGPRGGQIWCLTLSCGHLKFVRIPVFKAERIELYGKLKEAPRHCKCFSCK